MMEKAIEVMRQSVQEHRPDGSPSPQVGAVLVRPDGSIETAARGELRDGNHAEFTLLERKCAAENLEGCVLFATLEPCLNRNSPKRGCARHIVGARIREVYVGIEDDNPKVAGKGIEYLRRSGVTVHLFDRELQEVILDENKSFFEWARQQIDAIEDKKILLSKYELSATAVTLQDLSTKALNAYRTRAKLAPKVGSSDFQRFLLQQGILVESGDSVAPSGFGLLLFGEDSSLALPHGRLLARVELPNGKSSRKEFSEALVLLPGELEAWLDTVLPSTVDRRRMERKEAVDLPFEMIREAVVNALIHRDYDLIGQKCHLIITPDTITIKSPGGPIPPVTLDQMRAFSAPIKSRNPLLHYVFSRMGMAEEQGYGLSSLKSYAEDLGLPLPRYSMDGDLLVLTIYRNVESAIGALSPEELQSLSDSERQGWLWLATKDVVSSAEYAEAMGLAKRAATLHLKSFINCGLVATTGRGRSIMYHVLR
ncbi:hypothetical protein DSM3645_29881 [Blastopirellula marina DSM 3645]|uniref:CMP/dCMP-type deaminase domain-containing protein n=2 Tax=Blastopirellula marina TaxID=124 RepID=A3ZXK1_9BACT|nr:hypothetical protein DSM3645_29881 [Blastopirellula marina DSM 3645]